MDELNFFNSLRYLEPRCRKCNAVLDYGVNTEYSDKKKAQVCMKCGEIIE